jgi:class 3 adenylate cyclase/TolB-like protein
MSETRKLAAILVSDIVGYSRLAGADEDRILARLRTLRSDLIDPTIAVHHGRIIKRTGDGSIIEFRSVVDAVNCAIEVQRAMVERNAEVAPDKRIEFRIGIHLGDVVEESDGDLMGDGVNIAARLQSIAKPGSICLSEQAYWQVKGRLDLKVSDLGPTPLKNIAEPMRVYLLEVGQPAEAKPAVVVAADNRKSAGPAPKARALARWPTIAVALVVAALAAGAFAWHTGLAPRFISGSVEDKLAAAPPLSIIVLPFENLSGDKDQEYFADGITDDLTTDLSHLEGGFVISRGTAFTYKGKPVDAKQIGRELGVRYVLEGSVRRVDETITVNAQLISTESGAHVWADRFEGERGKLGALQVEVVARLARSLGVELVKAEALRTARERPNNPDAVDLAMRGLARINSGFGKAKFDAAIGDFERALQLDPELVRAQIGLAYALIARAYVFGGGNASVDYPRAEALLVSALSKEPNNASAHSTAALLAFARKQFSDALSKLDVAIEIDPNFAAYYAFRGVNRLFNGRAQDNISDLETAFRLSPRDPLRGLWENDMCGAYLHIAQWEQAVDWCRKSIANTEGLWWPYAYLAAANGWLGREAEANVAIDGLHKLMPGFTVQDFVKSTPSENPQYQRERARITEGLRKAGLPEGEKTTN